MVETIHYDGPCLYAMCSEGGPHEHPICPKCGAERYGNLFCETCTTEGKPFRMQELAKTQAAIAAMKAGR